MNWKEEFIRRLSVLNFSKEEILAAYDLKMVNLPHNLYKYRPPSEYAINNLDNDTVWLSSPTEYNDPFEFAEYIDFEKSREAIISLRSEEDRDKLKLLYKNENSMLLSKRATNTLNSLLLQSTIDRLQEIEDTMLKEHYLNILNEVKQKRKELFKVCSFCESPNDILMWGHYAQGHEGFCIEYNIGRWQLNEIRRNYLHPVIYIDDIYDSTDHFNQKMSRDILNSFYPILSATRKYIQWEYEKEWRLLIMPVDGSFPNPNYAMNCQSKVFIGCKMEHEMRLKIIDICRKRGIEIYQSKPAINAYKMDFELI